METFEVKRGLAKKLASEGGLAGVASKHFDNIDGDGDAFTGNHGIMTSISGEYNSLGKLVVDVSQVLPDFKDEDAMIAANDDRRRWSAFPTKQPVTTQNNVVTKPRKSQRKLPRQSRGLVRHDISWTWPPIFQMKLGLRPRNSLRQLKAFLRLETTRKQRVLQRN